MSTPYIPPATGYWDASASRFVPFTSRPALPIAPPAGLTVSPRRGPLFSLRGFFGGRA